MTGQRKKGEVESVRIGDLTKDKAFAAIADLTVGLTHEGPGLQRKWVFASQQIKLEELKRVTKLRAELTPEIAPEYFDGKKRKVKNPKAGAPKLNVDKILAELDEPPAIATEETLLSARAQTIRDLVALVRAMWEPEEIDQVVIEPFHDDDGNVQILTGEGLEAMSKFAERVVSDCAAWIRGSAIDGSANGKEIAAELARLGVVEFVSSKAMEVQSLTKAEKFPAPNPGNV